MMRMGEEVEGSEPPNRVEQMSLLSRLRWTEEEVMEQERTI